jgi:hypothetical protein
MHQQHNYGRSLRRGSSNSSRATRCCRCIHVGAVWHSFEAAKLNTCNVLSAHTDMRHTTTSWCPPPPPGLHIDPNNQQMKAALSDALSAKNRPAPGGGLFGPDALMKLAMDPRTRHLMDDRVRRQQQQQRGSCLQCRQQQQQYQQQ